MKRSCVGWGALVALAAASSALAVEPVEGLGLGDSLEVARRVATVRCGEHREVEVSPPSFPLARDEEIHLLCLGWETPRGTVERAAFVFGDGVLAAIEARGGAVAALAGESGEAESYLHYQVFNDWRRLADPATDTVWILDDGALHLNLFTWSNPFLSGKGEAAPAYRQSAAVPPLLDFEAPLAAQLARFEEECPLLEVSRAERVWLPNGPESQAQINCFGYEYAGFPRKFEAVYGDGRLHVVWILTGKGEEGRLRRALGEAFGEPFAVNEKWELFAGGRVGLRKDKPEVLLLSEEIAPLYRGEFGLE
jgi:hypothetical protein